LLRVSQLLAVHLTLTLTYSGQKPKPKYIELEENYVNTSTI